MDVERLFPLACGFAAFLLSIGLELLLKPRPCFRRGWRLWLAQYGIWSLLYAPLLFILDRPFCACAASLAFYLIIILVSNAKYDSLREPFLFQDYDYFLDTLRFPRLFLPFLGLRGFCLCALGVLLALLALWLEAPTGGRLAFSGVGGCCLFFLLTGMGSCFYASRKPFIGQPAPLNDLKKLGLPVFLLAYAQAGRKLPRLCTPFTSFPVYPKPEALPHLVALQSESFFDPRQIIANVQPGLLEAFDQFCFQAFIHGELVVPAWGANTVRTEFSFLSGTAASELGVHAFNPYQAMLRGWRVDCLPAFLRRLGYHTIFVHPYHAAFYGRARIFPRMGFDRFVDIKEFNGCEKAGAYVGDLCLGKKISDLLRDSTRPLFIFAVSMENHGPLMLEHTPDAECEGRLFQGLAPEDCPELARYLRHLENLNRMLEQFRQSCSNFTRPVSLCFYGDHVPIMPLSYKKLGYPQGNVPFFCWSDRQPMQTEATILPVNQLAVAWLEGLKLLPGNEDA